MPGHRRTRTPDAPTRRETTYRRRRGALNTDLATLTDPTARLDRAYDYARSALTSARDRDYPIHQGPGRVVLNTAVRALIAAGDHLLRPNHNHEKAR